MPLGLKHYSLLTKIIKRFILNPVAGAFSRTMRGLGFIDFPAPPNSNLRKTSATGNLFHYYVSGARCYLPIATMAESHGVNLRQGDLQILDFGCGVARLLLHFTRTYPNNRYYACDIDHTNVAFLQRHYPKVTSYTNEFTPPLDFPDASFDLIYSLSVFSHLNIDDSVIWLRDLARVVKPGGLLLLTTEGPTSLKWLCSDFGMDEASAMATLGRDGHMFTSYENWQEAVGRTTTLPVASSMVGVERPYGSMALSPEYIRHHWCTAGLTVLDIIEGIIDTRQDLVVLRRDK